MVKLLVGICLLTKLLNPKGTVRDFNRFLLFLGLL